MKINRNNQDLKIINKSRGLSCFSCALISTPHLCWCGILCSNGKVWIKDIFNSDIFSL